MERIEGPRRVVVVGRRARADGAFLLRDLPGSSGRVDVLARCLRAALLVSHGLRTHVVAYLVLLGGEGPPRALRFDASRVRFLRPDEASLATVVQKALLGARFRDHAGFAEVYQGVDAACDGLRAVLSDVGAAPVVALRESGLDVRAPGALCPSALHVVGDPEGFDAETDALLHDVGTHALSVGPQSLHAEDAIAVLWNELDRHAALAQQ